MFLFHCFSEIRKPQYEYIFYGCIMLLVKPKYTTVLKSKWPLIYDMAQSSQLLNSVSVRLSYWTSFFLFQVMRGFKKLENIQIIDNAINIYQYIKLLIKLIFIGITKFLQTFDCWYDGFYEYYFYHIFCNYFFKII